MKLYQIKHYRRRIGGPGECVGSTPFEAENESMAVGCAEGMSRQFAGESDWAALCDYNGKLIWPVGWPCA
jgi:hypothetical protein